MKFGRVVCRPPAPDAGAAEAPWGRKVDAGSRTRQTIAAPRDPHVPPTSPPPLRRRRSTAGPRSRLSLPTANSPPPCPSSSTRNVRTNFCRNFFCSARTAPTETTTGRRGSLRMYYVL